MKTHRTFQVTKTVTVQCTSILWWISNNATTVILDYLCIVGSRDFNESIIPFYLLELWAKEEPVSTYPGRRGGHIYALCRFHRRSHRSPVRRRFVLSSSPAWSPRPPPVLSINSVFKSEAPSRDTMRWLPLHGCSSRLALNHHNNY